MPAEIRRRSRAFAAAKAGVEQALPGAEAASHRLPADCVLLPLSDGLLVVSRGHAVFCRVPAADAATMRAVVAGAAPPGALAPALRDDLARHGFFGPPRPAKADPPTVQLQLTNACNLACAYCCTNSGAPRAAEVSFERMLDVVRRIPDALGPDTCVALLGGEPLLVPWALDLADAILALGLDLTLFSNGVPLAGDDRLAARVAGLVARGTKLRISLAGASAETCDALSGPGRFEAALNGLRRVADHGGSATVDLMLVPQHVDTVARDLPRLRRRLPAGTPVALGILYRGGREDGARLFASRSALDAALDRVAFEAGEAVSAPRPSPVAPRREGCPCALGRHVHVRSDGALFNCFKMEERVGDLDAPGFDAAARWIREHPRRAGELPACEACALATLCGGGCRSENQLYTGEPDTPPCGPWRVRVLSELLAEDRATAVEWPVAHLLDEARRRGIETPVDLAPRLPSRHLVDVR